MRRRSLRHCVHCHSLCTARSCLLCPVLGDVVSRSVFTDATCGTVASPQPASAQQPQLQLGECVQDSGSSFWIRPQCTQDGSSYITYFFRQTHTRRSMPAARSRGGREHFR